MSAIELSTPAKINLTLAVLSRRTDGFHEIESWITPIDLFDRLTFHASRDFTLTIRNADPQVAADPTNLVWKAAALLSQASGRPLAAQIELNKRIPVGAGLGGGSSDAAATLLGLNRLWQLHWPIDQLVPLAARIGSDVPFFLSPQPSIMRGRGERLEPLANEWNGWIALIVPPFSLATAEVYRHCEPRPNPANVGRPWLERELTANALHEHLFNDLESSAFKVEPRFKVLFNAINTLGKQRVHMTGSGSCLFCLFDDSAAAERWAQSIQACLDRLDQVRVIRTLGRISG